MLLASQNVLVIHTPKCGGSSVLKYVGERGGKAIRCLFKSKWETTPRKSLIMWKKNPFPKASDYVCNSHLPASYCEAALGTKYFEKLYKIGLVRNPWKWAISMYLYLQRTHVVPTNKPFSVFLQEGGIVGRRKGPPDLPWSFDLMGFNENGRLLVNHIHRFEELHTLPALFAKHGILPLGELAHINFAPAIQQKRDWKDYYWKNPRSFHMVAAYFPRTIRYGNYNVDRFHRQIFKKEYKPLPRLRTVQEKKKHQTPPRDKKPTPKSHVAEDHTTQ